MKMKECGALFVIRASCIVQCLVVFSALLLFGSYESRATTDESRNVQAVGVLVLAHGGSARWNRAVEIAVRQARLTQPTEVAFGMGMHEPEAQAIQHAVDQLERRGIARLIVVPFLVSSSSDVLRQYQYVLGLRADGPWQEHVKPLTLHVPVVMAGALDADPLVAAVLTERAKDLSRKAQQETVMLVAHGPVSEEDNARWLGMMEQLAQEIQTQAGFHAVIPVTLRDDAPKEVREEAVRQMREVVKTGSEHGRVLVVPLLLAEGGIEQKIPKALKGLPYVFRGKTLLPHLHLSQWIAQQVASVPESIVLK